MRAAVLLLALALLAGVSVVAVPEASACIQVYPYSELCGKPVQGAKKVVCWETDGRVCLP